MSACAECVCTERNSGLTRRSTVKSPFYIRSLHFEINASDWLSQQTYDQLASKINVEWALNKRSFNLILGKSVTLKSYAHLLHVDIMLYHSSKLAFEQRRIIVKRTNTIDISECVG